MMKKRKLDEAGASGKGDPAGGSSSDPLARKKKRANPVKKPLPDVASTKEQLVHKNRELAVKARRLRDRLRKSQQEVASHEKQRASVEGVLSSVTRGMDRFLEEGLQLLGEKLDVRIDPTGSGPAELDEKALSRLGKAASPDEFAQLLFGRSMHALLARQVSRVVPDMVDEEEEEDDDDAANRDRRVENLPELADKEVSRKVKLMLAVLRSVVARLLGEGGSERDRAVKALLAVDGSAEAAALQARVREAEERCKLYADRVAHLETQARRFQNDAEDAQVEKDRAQRRLAALCSDALTSEELHATAEKLREKGVDVNVQGASVTTRPGSTANGSAATSGAGAAGGPSSASSSSLSAASAPANEDAGATNGDAGAEGGHAEAAAQLQEAERLASDRLKELEKELEEKKKLVAENEELRSAKDAAQAAHTHHSHNGGTDHRVVEALQGELGLVKVQLQQVAEAEAQERQLASAARDALKKLEERVGAELAERNLAFAREVREAQAETETLRSELASARLEADKVRKLEAQVAEGEAQLKLHQRKLSTATNQLAQLKKTPPHVHDETLRTKLAELAEGKWPDDADLRDAASLRVQLDAAQAALKSAQEDLGVATRDLEDTANEFATLEKARNELAEEIRSLHQVVAEKNERYIAMDRERGAADKEMRLAVRERDMLRTQIQEHEAQFRQQYERLAVVEESGAASQEHARLTYEHYQTTARASEEQRKEMEQTKAAMAELEQKAKDLERRNAQLRVQMETADHERKRALEDRKKMKTKLERARTMTTRHDPGAPTTELEERLAGMENALRCPLNNEYWRDAIIIKCCHTFSKKALYDNLEKRNRKCPSCKALYNKQDIRSIYLYQKNEYDE